MTAPTPLKPNRRHRFDPRTEQEAERCLIAVCVTLCFPSGQGANLPLWTEILAQVYCQCGDGASALAGVRGAVKAFLEAEASRERNACLERIKLEVETYFAAAAAHRYEVFKDLAPRSERAG